MNALDAIKKKIEHNEPVSNIELAIFNSCLSIPFPTTAKEAAAENAAKDEALRLALEERDRLASLLCDVISVALAKVTS